MSAIDSSTNNCPQCGIPISNELTEGLCPRCLLAAAMEHTTDSEPAETMDSGSAKLQAAGSLLNRFESLGERDSQPMTFGDYVLVNEIARGGMGVVYRARHQKLGREVAMKVILSGQFASANDVRRFEMEAESAAALDHPGIVPIYEIGQHQGHHFFTMKLIEGGSLAKKLPELRKDMRVLVAIIAQVAEAIDYAHRRGILHRDIKPANILLDGDGQALVTDLGLAKRTETDSDLTGTGAIVGTPAYMPPEQASASKEITTAVDVYALGAILYEGLTGRPPHQGDSPLATLMLAAKGDIEKPSEHNAKVDRTLELICMKCLDRDPDSRYGSAAHFRDDLLRWLAGESVSVKPKSLVAVFGDFVNDQLRSAIGVMLLGVGGGFALGFPIYVGITNDLFGRPGSRFSIERLRESLPSSEIATSWWLSPPEFLNGPPAILGLMFCLVLGLMIRKLVRPKHFQEALAIGLVAGLLMAIVEFGMYGIAASWRTFSLANADQIDLLANAAMSKVDGREKAIQGIFNNYPDLQRLPEDRRAKVLSQVVSTQIMLSSPPVALVCLSGCLVFACVYCVLGTVHAFRLSQQTFSRGSRLLRYFEVLLLLTAAGVLFCLCVFILCGMVTDSDVRVSLTYYVWFPCLVTSLLVIPGWMMWRWYSRWATYAIGLGTLWFVLSF